MLTINRAPSEAVGIQNLDIHPHTYYHPILITIRPPSLYPHQTPVHRLFNTSGGLASLQHLKTLSDSPGVIHGMSVMHWRWTSRRPMQLPVRATVSGYLSRHLICVRGWQYNVWHRGWPMPPRTVKQTEKHLCVLTVNLPHIDCCY